MSTRSGIKQWTTGLLAALMLTACDRESTPFEPVTPVVSVEVVGPLIEVPVGASVTLTATPRAADGSALTDRPVVWSSSDTAVATVSAGGVLAARTAGVVTIRATSGGKTGSIELGIIAMGPAVARITITPGANVMRVGSTRQYSAVAWDVNNQPVDGLPVVWSSTDPTRAQISANGLTTALAHGYTDIRATIGGRTAAVALTIEQAEPQIPVHSVLVAPRERPVWVGEQLQMSGLAFARTGGELHGRPVSWSSESPAIATVSATGLLTAVAPGTVRIRAEIEGKVGFATIRVRARPTGNVHEYRLVGTYDWRTQYVEIGPALWTDAHGVVHNAYRVITAGKLRLDFTSGTMPTWTQEFTIATYLSGPTPQPPVASQTITNSGLLWLNWTDGTYVLKSGPLEIATRNLFAGEMAVHQSVLGSPVIGFIWELQ